MTTKSQDYELIAEFAAEGDESAFQALVERHAGLVYATALRQVGQSTLAEEITQNTFLALARKARRLGRKGTLAGWLHRTALLESKACWRREMRRQKREAIAAADYQSQTEGQSPLASLLPMLDEALLNLREHDRQALILRYLEESSLKEVADFLGIAEDTARKRVQRALQRVMDFFKRRGFSVPGGAAGITSLLSVESAVAVPPGLLSSVASAATSTSVASATSTWAGVSMMGLSKSSAAVGAMVLTLVIWPLVSQWRSHADLVRETEARQLEQQSLSSQLADLRAANVRARENLQRMELALMNQELQNQRDFEPMPAAAPGPLAASAGSVEWDDEATLTPIPKAVLSKLVVSSVENRRGALSSRMLSLLQCTDEEGRRLQEAVDQFFLGYQHYLTESMEQVTPSKEELSRHSRDEVKVFEVAHDPDRFRGMRSRLLSQVKGILGDERSRLFSQGLQSWLPLEDEDTSINSGMLAVNAAHSFVIYRPEPGSDRVAWKIQVKRGGAVSMTTSRQDFVEWLPPAMKDSLQDWIRLATPDAQSQPLLIP